MRWLKRKRLEIVEILVVFQEVCNELNPSLGFKLFDDSKDQLHELLVTIALVYEKPQQFIFPVCPVSSCSCILVDGEERLQIPTPHMTALLLLVINLLN